MLLTKVARRFMQDKSIQRQYLIGLYGDYTKATLCHGSPWMDAGTLFVPLMTTSDLTVASSGRPNEPSQISAGAAIGSVAWSTKNAILCGDVSILIRHSRDRIQFCSFHTSFIEMQGGILSFSLDKDFDNYVLGPRSFQPTLEDCETGVLRMRLEPLAPITRNALIDLYASSEAGTHSALSSNISSACGEQPQRRLTVQRSPSIRLVHCSFRESMPANVTPSASLNKTGSSFLNWWELVCRFRIKYTPIVSTIAPDVREFVKRHFALIESESPLELESPLLVAFAKIRTRSPQCSLSLHSKGLSLCGQLSNYDQSSDGVSRSKSLQGSPRRHFLLLRKKRSSAQKQRDTLPLFSPPHYHHDPK